MAGRLTDYGLRVFGARGAEAELAQGVFGLLREGVEARLGGLGSSGAVLESGRGCVAGFDRADHVGFCCYCYSAAIRGEGRDGWVLYLAEAKEDRTAVACKLLP